MDKFKSLLVEYRVVLVLLLIGSIARVFLIGNITISGISMESTFHDAERAITWKIGDPQRFDVVVFRVPEEKKYYIKRVIGVPGDVVEYRNDQLFVNGEEYREPYLEENHAATTGALTRNIKEQYVVPEGHYFVLGDNRQHSTDSRKIGFVPKDRITGIVKMVYWPLQNIRLVH